jgi:hypothetical protein
MTQRALPSKSTLRNWGTCLVMTCVALLSPGAVRADLIVSAGSKTANAGSTGNSFDVTLTNTGPSSVTIGGFNFELKVTNTAITFTSATTGTSSPYIFDGLGLFGPTIGTGSAQTIDASDVYSVIGSGATLGSGVTVGLGHVIFSVAPGAASAVVPVVFTAFPSTSLSDVAGRNVAINTLSSGTITIVGSAVVPEPSPLVLTGFSGLLALVVTKLRRRRAAA